MRAVILAAGQGTRLRPLTDDRPKCLVSIFGKPIIEHQLDALRSAGVKDVYAVAGYRSEQLQKYFPEKLFLNPSFETTNMVASLFSAMSLFNSSEELLILYGDLVYSPLVVNEVIESDAEIAVAVDDDWLSLWAMRMEDPLQDAERLTIDGNGLIQEIGGKPDDIAQIDSQYLGIIKLTETGLRTFREQWEHLLKTDEKNANNLYMTEFLQLLINSKQSVAAIRVRGGCIEVDSVSDLLAYESEPNRAKLKGALTLSG